MVSPPAPPSYSHPSNPRAAIFSGATGSLSTSQIILHGHCDPFSPWGEGARRADEGAFPSRKEVPPHQFGRMTYGRAIERLLAATWECATVSHGLSSSPQRGEAPALAG